MRSTKMLLVAAALLTLGAWGAPRSNTPDANTIKTSDFSWMTGRWIGHFTNPDLEAEEICSLPRNGHLFCLFRIFVHARPVFLELNVIQDTADGVELRSRHFDPEMAEKQVQSPLVLKLTKYGEKEIVFSGAPGSEVVTSTMFRDTLQTMNSVVVLADSKAKSIRVRWEKVEYAAPVQ